MVWWQERQNNFIKTNIKLRHEEISSLPEVWFQPVTFAAWSEIGVKQVDIWSESKKDRIKTFEPQGAALWNV